MKAKCKMHLVKSVVLLQLKMLNNCNSSTRRAYSFADWWRNSSSCWNAVPVIMLPRNTLMNWKM